MGIDRSPRFSAVSRLGYVRSERNLLEFQHLRVFIHSLVAIREFIDCRESLRGIVIIFIFKYTDSLTESLVSCASLILASFVSSAILHRVLPISFYISILNLSIATYLYESAPETPNVLKKAESAPAESIEFEKE